MEECTKTVLCYFQSKALLEQLKVSEFAWFHGEFISSCEYIFLLPPASFILVPFICRAPSDRRTLLCIALCFITFCRMCIDSVIHTDWKQSQNNLRLRLERSKRAKRVLFFCVYTSFCVEEITKPGGSDHHCSACSSVSVSRPLYVGGSHRDIPLDVLNRGGAMLMGTMHQLIVFLCVLVSHSSSALVVIFLSEFTLEKQRLF